MQAPFLLCTTYVVKNLSRLCTEFKLTQSRGERTAEQATHLRSVHVYLLTASRAASLVRAIKSAPTKPGVARANIGKLKSALSFSDWHSTRRILQTRHDSTQSAGTLCHGLSTAPSSSSAKKEECERWSNKQPQSKWWKEGDGGRSMKGGGKVDNKHPPPPPLPPSLLLPWSPVLSTAVLVNYRLRFLLCLSLRSLLASPHILLLQDQFDV